MRQARRSVVAIAVTTRQRQAIGRLSKRLGMSRSSFLSMKLGRKFWKDVDREVVKAQNQD